MSEQYENPNHELAMSEMTSDARHNDVLILTSTIDTTPKRVQLPAIRPEDQVKELRNHLLRLAEEERRDKLKARENAPVGRKSNGRVAQSDIIPPYIFINGKMVDARHLVTMAARKQQAEAKHKGELVRALGHAKALNLLKKKTDHVVCIYEGTPNAMGYKPPFTSLDTGKPGYQEKMDNYKQEWLMASRVEVEVLDREKMKINSEIDLKIIIFRLDTDNNYLPVELVTTNGDVMTMYGREIIDAENKIRNREEKRKIAHKEGNAKPYPKTLDLVNHINSDKLKDFSDSLGNKVIFAREGVFHEQFDVVCAFKIAMAERTLSDLALGRKPTIVQSDEGTTFYPTKRSQKKLLSMAVKIQPYLN